MSKSFLDDIPGIGPQKKKAFSSPESVKKTSKKEIISVVGIIKALADEILKI